MASNRGRHFKQVTAKMSAPSSSSDADKAIASEKDVNPESTVLALSNDSDKPSVLEGPDENDDRNPQNWSPWKKRLVFLALMSSSILADGYVDISSLGRQG